MLGSVETPEQKTPLHYRICVKEHVDPSWQPWFAGLEITHEASGMTLLSGPLPDQAALYGVLLKIARLGLTLISLETIEDRQSAR